MSADHTSPYVFSVSILLYVILAFHPLMQGSSAGWQHSVASALVTVVMAFLILEKLHFGRPIFQSTSLANVIVITIIWFCITVVFAKSYFMAIDSGLWLFNYIIIFYATLAATQTRKQQRTLVFVILGIAAYLSLARIFVQLGFIIQPLQGTSVSSSIYPVFATDPRLSGYLAIAFSLLLGLGLSKSLDGFSLIMIICCGILLSIAQFLTFSPWGWAAHILSLVFMGTVLLFQKRFRRKGLLLAIAGVNVLLLFFVLMNSKVFHYIIRLTGDVVGKGNELRRLSWSGTLEMIKDYPLTGSGPGSYSTIFTQYQPPGSDIRLYHAYSDYFHYVAELGVIALGIILWLISLVFIAGFRKLSSKSRQTWGMTLGAMSGLVALLLHGTVDYIIHLPANATLLTVLVALIVKKVDRRNFNATI